MTRGKGIRPFGEHVDDLIPVYFAEITSLCCAHCTIEAVAADMGCDNDPSHPLRGCFVLLRLTGGQPSHRVNC